jgi:hypothetical protein
MHIFALELAWQKSTMRLKASRWVSFHSPVSPGEMRASGEGHVISTYTRPAPPTARLPRCTKCQSPGTPSTALYWSIGDTTTRFSSTMSRSRNGVNIGTGGFSRSISNPLFRTCCANQRWISRTKPGSRSSRFSQVICLERDITPKANCTGSMSQ